MVASRTPDNTLAPALLLFSTLVVSNDSWANQLSPPDVEYSHLAPERVLSVYRDAYAKSGLVQFSRRVISNEVFSGGRRRVSEEILISKPIHKGNEEHVRFYFDAYTRNDVCINCVISMEGYSFKNYEEDWRAIRRIRQSLGQNLAPVCNTACPASVEDWINSKSDKTPAPDIHQYPPGHQPEAAGHQ